MCTVLLPLGVNPNAGNIYRHAVLHLRCMDSNC